MKFRTRMALLALSAGAVVLAEGGCFFRWLGDIIGDFAWLRAID